MTPLAALLTPAIASDPDEDDYSARIRLVPPGGALVLFYRSEGPLSFVAMTPRDLPAGWTPAEEVSGRSCQNALSIPLVPPTLFSRGPAISGAVGDGSYGKALAALGVARPDLAGVFDVKVDLHTRTVLGIFTRFCTVVHARGFKTS